MAENAKAETLRNRSEPSAKNERNEYATFETSLRKILSVPRAEVMAKLNGERHARKARKRTSRASSEKD